MFHWNKSAVTDSDTMIIVLDNIGLDSRINKMVLRSNLLVIVGKTQVAKLFYSQYHQSVVILYKLTKKTTKPSPSFLTLQVFFGENGRQVDLRPLLPFSDISSQEEYSSSDMDLTGQTKSTRSSSSRSSSRGPGNSWSYKADTDSENPGMVNYSYIDSTGETVIGTASAEDFQNDNPLKELQESQDSFQPSFNQNNRMRYGAPAFVNFPNNFGRGNNNIFRNGHSSNFKNLNSAGNTVQSSASEGPGINSALPGADSKFSQTASGSKNSNSYSTSSKSNSVSGIGPDGKPYSRKVYVNEVNDNGKVTIERVEE
ncbi:uncharacterized protein DDB_G0283357-like [Diprion similis]|uniref:uncharacterized protein DDB_G0283357-like n=1 Tax=Diprion similis TaxID=362088 RepID=UPI001EF7DD81|nr:uncharacterized protein DDB_G0283357-like [Diprion similis]